MKRLTVANQLLRSFQRPSFRFLWLSDGISSSAEQMESLVLAWFILTETDSPFLVGLYGALRFTGTLFAPLFGIVVDRYDRRRLLTGARLGFASVALAILVLSFSGLIQVWHVFILVGITGMGRAFDNVTRQTMLADLVERAELSNAVALTRTGRDATQILGPVIGGLMLAQFGLGWTYALVLSLHTLGALMTLKIATPGRTPVRMTASLLGDLSQTARYVRKEEVILALLLMAFLVNLTGFPLNQGLMPVFARDVLGTGAAGLGQLLGAYSVGGFLGSVIIAGLARMSRPGRVMILGSVAWHAGILVVSQTRWFGGAVGVLAMTGMAQSFCMVTMSIVLLSATSTEIRGRIMGLRSLAVYGLPLGLLASGAVADAFGVMTALVINGVVGIVITALITVWLRKLWRVA